MATSYAIFSAQYRPHVGGIEIFTEHLAHELVRTGDRVHIITSRMPDAPDHELQPDGVEVWRLPTRLLLQGRLPIPHKGQEYRELYQLLLQLPIDRVLVNTRFYGLSIEGLAYAKAKGIPAVVLDHGSDWLTLGNPLLDGVLHAYERRITEQVKAYHPQFAGISRRSCEWLQTFGIETGTVIPNAIDARKFRGTASGRDFRRELGVTGSERLVAFVGRLSSEKGALQLAEAARLIGERCVVAMAGEGNLRKKIEGLKLPNVHLLGSLPSEDVSELLAQSDLFCLPSRSEGFCTALLEAAAWGVTPVVTSFGGAAEVMGDPPECGKFLSNTDPEVVAWTLVEAIRTRKSEASTAMRTRIERDCSWTATARSLRAAFGEG